MDVGCLMDVGESECVKIDELYCESIGDEGEGKGRVIPQVKFRDGSCPAGYGVNLFYKEIEGREVVEENTRMT